MTNDQMEMYRKVMEAVKEDDFQPTEWESNFLRSIISLSHDGRIRPLTEKQDAALERLWMRATGQESGTQREDR